MKGTHWDNVVRRSWGNYFSTRNDTPAYKHPGPKCSKCGGSLDDDVKQYLISSVKDICWSCHSKDNEGRYMPFPGQWCDRTCAPTLKAIGAIKAPHIWCRDCISTRSHIKRR